MSSSWYMCKIVLSIVLGLGLMVVFLVVQVVNNDGLVFGYICVGVVVMVINFEIGLICMVIVDGNGNYCFVFLLVGWYMISVSQDGQVVVLVCNVIVVLGIIILVNFGFVEVIDLFIISVIGLVLLVIDVSFIELVIIVLCVELVCLLVDQNVVLVVLLVLGVVKGDVGFGGIFFGGLLIVENLFYVNGFNVIDFYNCNGFLEVLFVFYDQFQVKIGGYLVEFGCIMGGVVNVVVCLGINEFYVGIEIIMELGNWYLVVDDYYIVDGCCYFIVSCDMQLLIKINVWVFGFIVKDKLFFFVMYEVCGNMLCNINDVGMIIIDNCFGIGFWGIMVDWNVIDFNILLLMVFLNKNYNVGDVYVYDFDINMWGQCINQVFIDIGGCNWVLIWISYFINDLLMKLMYGCNECQLFICLQLDLDCNVVVVSDVLFNIDDLGVLLGCIISFIVYECNDICKQGCVDFEWILGDYLLCFGYDYENNMFDYVWYYVGLGEYYYNVYVVSVGVIIFNGVMLLVGYEGYVCVCCYEIVGIFIIVDLVYYFEDNWQVMLNLVFNVGLCNDSFDNQDVVGCSYIKMDCQIVLCLGFFWDMKGDGSIKLFGNFGCYYLLVVNVINIKQVGGLFDECIYYVFNGWNIQMLDGVEYVVFNFGFQLGNVDILQGDGMVGDLCLEVDKNMDLVYQDEVIFGFQQMLNVQWLWGVSVIYCWLYNVIDDMEISVIVQCGENGYIGWVMVNLGKKVIVWGDINCDGNVDGYFIVDMFKEGWVMYDVDGNYLGQCGWVKFKCIYGVFEFQFDCVWDDKWVFNVSYIIFWNCGNVEGLVNLDINFDDIGCIENFDDLWVNLGGDGYLFNDCWYQLKVCGIYVLILYWQFGGDLDVYFGGLIIGFGVGNFYDVINYYSYFICVQNCELLVFEDCVYECLLCGKYGCLLWIYNLGVSISYLWLFEGGNLCVKLVVYNLFNQQCMVQVDQDLQIDIFSFINFIFW